MKILYVTTIGGTMGFFKSFIKELLDRGHTVDIATNESTSQVPSCYCKWGCTIHQIETSRSPLSKSNLVAVKELQRIVSKNNYDIVHCHTPIAAACTRIACRKARKKGTKVFYTAHGFHFYKGAPLKNWLIFYPIEKLCACWTDVLITINKEDYTLAQRNLKAKRVVYVPGVGIDVSRFANVQVDKAAKRQEMGVPEDAFLLLSVGELNENKNHQVIIRALAQLNDHNIHYAIAGSGDLSKKLENLAKELGVENQLHLLGYRTDVVELYKTADLFAHPSFREGLPVSIMEAMSSGLPVACSKIRGNVDLIDENGGTLFNPHNLENCTEAIEKILLSGCMHELGEYNANYAKTFESNHIHSLLKKLYEL